MEGVCFFDRGRECGILDGDKHCKGCKFFKIESQFYYDSARAEQLLKAKGLESYKTLDNIISTRKIRED